MIYLDNAASTRVAEEVIALVGEVGREDYGNPSSAHPAGAAARRRIAKAREQVLAAIGDAGGAGGAKGDVVWTSGGTEANALGVLGAARAAAGARRSIVVSALEHPAVAASAAMGGGEVRVVGVNADGVVDVGALREMIDETVRVVAVMLVSNELGAVQPIAEIARVVKERAADCHVHCDATQAIGKVAVDVGMLGVDSLGMAGHKLHGPKGAGALWLRDGARVAALWGGGGQQKGLRHGTQDAPGAAGLGLAIERAVAAMPEAAVRWAEMAEVLCAAARGTGVEWKLLAPGVRAPHIVSLGFAGVSADGMRNLLASRGVIASSGSACASSGGHAAHGALDAIGLPATWGMVRFSFGLETRVEEVVRAAEVMVEVVRDLAKQA